jgi:type IV pilus modification protein PilV
MNIKTCKKNINKKQSGFTLIEVMIALVILAVGLLALMTMQIVSIKANAFSSEMTYASMLAQARFEQLRNTAYDSIAPTTGFEDDVPVSADETTKGTSYTVQRKVEDNTPATDMKRITLKIDWQGMPAGSSGGSTLNFTTSFVTVIKK